MENKKWFLNGGRGSGKTIRILCEIFENRIAELEKQLNFKTRYVKGEKAIEQLAQAKEIITELHEIVVLSQVRFVEIDVPAIQKKAEQFLKEIEK